MLEPTTEVALDDWEDRVADIARRAARTFLQAAVAVLVASGAGYVDAEVWEAAGIAGGAAVLSFVQRLLDTP